MGVLCVLFVTASLASAKGGDVGPVGDAIARFNQHAEHPLPAISARRMRRLANGRMVSAYLPPDAKGEAAGVLGLMVSEVDPTLVWLAVRDPHMSVSDGLVEHIIGPARPKGDETWLGLLRMPSPFEDRYWRITVRTEIGLSAATQGRACERSWKLIPNGETLTRRDAAAGRFARLLSADDFKDAVFTPANHGSWIVMKLADGRSLLGYRVTTDVGGVIHPELVRQFALLRLENLLLQTLEEARQIHRHYRGDHAIVHDGRGEPIPLFK